MGVEVIGGSPKRFKGGLKGNYGCECRGIRGMGLKWNHGVSMSCRGYWGLGIAGFLGDFLDFKI